MELEEVEEARRLEPERGKVARRLEPEEVRSRRRKVEKIEGREDGRREEVEG